MALSLPNTSNNKFDQNFFDEKYKHGGAPDRRPNIAENNLRNFEVLAKILIVPILPLKTISPNLSV